jgi:dTDP-glucose 4,6-dehydratase
MYDEAKRFSEALTMAYRRHHRVDTGIVRIFNTYGPRMATQDGRMIPEFISRALRGEPLIVSGDGSQTRSLCYVTDTVDGLRAMGGSSHAGPINLGNPVEQSVDAIAHRIIAATGSPSTIEHVPGRPDDPHRRCPDIAQAREVLGWAPRTGWDEGLAHTIGWFEQRHR